MYYPNNLFKLVLTVAFTVACAACTHGPDTSHPNRAPECLYIPEPPDIEPIDPFTMNDDNDGMTDQQRMDFIRRGVASTVMVRARRYAPEKGYTFYSGSGVFIDESHVLTAEHVVHDATDLYVILRRMVSGGLDVGYLRFERTEVERSDEDRDVALLRVYCPAELAHPMPIARNWTPQTNELLWQFGVNTGWSRGRVVRQVPDNILSGNTAGMVQMQMMGQCGDSGGPVTTTSGELVGLVLRGCSDEGRQYFVPIDTALRSVGRTP